MDREKDALTEIAQRHEFEIISLGSNRRHMDLPEYRAAIQGAEAVQEQTAAATQELTDLQEQKTELKREIKSLSGASAALKAAERVRVDFDTIRPEKRSQGLSRALRWSRSGISRLRPCGKRKNRASVLTIVLCALQIIAAWMLGFLTVV